MLAGVELRAAVQLPWVAQERPRRLALAAAPQGPTPVESAEPLARREPTRVEPLALQELAPAESLEPLARQELAPAGAPEQVAPREASPEQVALQEAAQAASPEQVARQGARVVGVAALLTLQKRAAVPTWSCRQMAVVSR